MEGNLRFKIDWASLIVGSKFTVFALFYFVFEGNFPSTSPRGAYIWRGLFSEFYGICNSSFCFTVYDQCVSHMLCIQEIYKPCFARNYVLI